jgi:hypothetical protein
MSGALSWDVIWGVGCFASGRNMVVVVYPKSMKVLVVSKQQLGVLNDFGTGCEGVSDTIVRFLVL